MCSTKACPDYLWREKDFSYISCFFPFSRVYRGCSALRYATVFSRRGIQSDPIPSESESAPVDAVAPDLVTIESISFELDSVGSDSIQTDSI